jgi:hypothetical protein
MMDFKILYKGKYTGVIRKIAVCSICKNIWEGLSVGSHHICFECWDSIFKGIGENSTEGTQEVAK